MLLYQRVWTLILVGLVGFGTLTCVLGHTGLMPSRSCTKHCVPTALLTVTHNGYHPAHLSHFLRKPKLIGRIRQTSAPANQWDGSPKVIKQTLSQIFGQWKDNHTPRHNNTSSTQTSNGGVGDQQQSYPHADTSYNANTSHDGASSNGSSNHASTHVNELAEMPYYNANTTDDPIPTHMSSHTSSHESENRPHASSSHPPSPHASSSYASEYGGEKPYDSTTHDSAHMSSHTSSHESENRHHASEHIINPESHWRANKGAVGSDPIPTNPIRTSSHTDTLQPFDQNTQVHPHSVQGNMQGNISYWHLDDHNVLERRVAKPGSTLHNMLKKQMPKNIPYLKLENGEMRRHFAPFGTPLFHKLRQMSQRKTLSYLYLDSQGLAQRRIAWEGTALYDKLNRQESEGKIRSTSVSPLKNDRDELTQQRTTPNASPFEDPHNLAQHDGISYLRLDHRGYASRQIARKGTALYDKLKAMDVDVTHSTGIPYIRSEKGGLRRYYAKPNTPLFDLLRQAEHNKPIPYLMVEAGEMRRHHAPPHSAIFHKLKTAQKGAPHKAPRLSHTMTNR